MTNEWDKILKNAGVIWNHDGDLRRPFALLTSGAISADFVDLSYAMAQPRIIAKAAIELANQLRTEYGTDEFADEFIICGQMKGSTTLASRVAEELGCGFIFTNKVGEGPEKKMVVDERFSGIHDPESTVILVEDVSTSTLTSKLSRDGLKDFGFTTISAILATLADRTGGSNDHHFEIKSCYVPEGFRTWVNGENPFTDDGQEVLEPIRAKSKEGRKAMHQVFA
ncbi:MAG: orotate phosphoribosyltransferase [Acidimicrobiales bacterium]